MSALRIMHRYPGTTPLLHARNRLPSPIAPLASVLVPSGAAVGAERVPGDVSLGRAGSRLALGNSSAVVTNREDGEKPTGNGAFTTDRPVAL